MHICNMLRQQETLKSYSGNQVNFMEMYKSQTEDRNLLNKLRGKSVGHIDNTAKWSNNEHVLYIPGVLLPCFKFLISASLKFLVSSLKVYTWVLRYYQYYEHKIAQRCHKAKSGCGATKCSGCRFVIADWEQVCINLWNAVLWKGQWQTIEILVRSGVWHLSPSQS